MSLLSTLPEADVVVQLQKGDRGAGDELYRRYKANLERYCYHMTHDHQAAADATHDAFVTALEKVNDLRDVLSFKGWLFRIARNCCLMAARNSRGDSSLDDTPEVWEDTTPLTLVLGTELSQLVLNAMSQLKPVYREALVLREFESMTYQEIALATDSSVASVKFRLHKARRALADSLGEYLDERETS